MLVLVPRTYILLILSVAATLSGCGDQGEAGSVGAFGPPGTALGDGFEVAEGTLLIGDPIPLGRKVPPPAGAEVTDTADEPRPLDRGWVATLVVDGGDPIDVMEAYVEQAVDAGMVEKRGTGCWIHRDEEGWDAQCEAFARSPDRAAPVSLGVEFVRGQRLQLASDHVILRYSTTDVSWEFGCCRDLDAVDVEIPPSPALPRLTSLGEPLPNGGEPVHDLIVEAGSRLAGPPHLNLRDATGGISAIFEVTGDPATVLARYREQLAGAKITGLDPITVHVDGATVTTLYADEAGGDHFELVLVERPGRPTWLSVDAGHD